MNTVCAESLAGGKDCGTSVETKCASASCLCPRKASDFTERSCLPPRVVRPLQMGNGNANLVHKLSMSDVSVASNSPRRVCTEPRDRS